MLGNLNLSYENQLLLFSGTIAGTALFAYYIFKSCKSNIKLTKWKVVGEVANLYLYPLKSGHYIKLDQAECTEFGLKQCKEDERAFQMKDRFLIVYREADKTYCTSKTFPKMVLIEVSVHDHEHLAIDAPNMRTLYIQIPSLLSKENHENMGHVYLWEHQEIVSIDCGNEAASWLSRYILDTDSGLRLGFHDASERRNLKEHLPGYLKVYNNLRDESTGLYADIASYLFVNQSSVDELNTKLTDVQISHKNFRANIVIKGKDLLAFDEDDWEFVQIGDILFRFVKYCPRCLVVNVDPETGNRISGGEPITTLKRYRKLKEVKNIDLEGEFPLLGIYCELVEGNGNVIKVGQTVSVKKRN